MQRQKKKSLVLSTTTLRTLKDSTLVAVAAGYQEITDIPGACTDRSLNCHKYV